MSEITGDTGLSREPLTLEAIQMDHKDKQLLAKLNSWFDKCSSQRQNEEQQWYLNMAFYFGKQWVTWIGAQGNPGTFRLHEPPAPAWRVRLTINRIKPIIRNELTKLTKEEPQPFVMPNSADEKDISAARAAESIFEYLMFETKFNRHRRAATLWALLTGTGFFKTYYDPNQLDNSKIPGKMITEAPSPYHMFVPLLQEEEIEVQPYIIQAMTKDKGWVKQRFGKEVQEDSEVAGGAFEQKLLNVLGINKNLIAHKMCHVKEIWVKPCHEYPNGMVAWFTKDTLLEVLEGWPYTHGMYPFIKISHIPTTKFYGGSVITDLIPLQREYNKSRSAIIESKNRMAKPQLLVAQGSIDPRKVTSEPGQMIQYKLGFPVPTPLPLQPLPNYVMQEMDSTLKDMDDISGQYEVTRGRTPPGVEAASAIAYLQEENDSRLHHTVASIEEAVQDIGRQLLSLCGQYWDIPRLVNVVGKTGLQEAMEFKGSDLNGNYDLRIESGSMAPRSRAARQAFITELMKMQVIDPAKGMRYLQMSETNAMFSEMQVDVRQVQRENLKLSAQPEVDMETGIPAPIMVDINPFDDHMVHLLEHEKFMKSQEYEILPPENKEAFLQHWIVHKEQAMALMAPPPGGQPVEEGNSQPQ